MGERVRKLRKTLDLTQREFGERINLKSNSVALIEGGRNTSDQTIASICREFNVNETWLRTGEGEMFIPAPTSELEALASRYPTMTHETYVLVEKLVNLPKASQDIIMGFMREVVEGFGDVAPGIPAKVPQEMTREEIHMELDRQLDEEKNQADGQSASGLGGSEKATG
ncbi:MAG: helix-turn-helix transcriptional regulator [Oscillospiraceae bacterium]|nr:helix-turn-helix transcriptional regulator [Oscillospiraceae bacterium]